jgi:phage/conjugal plasmid C-4 type zinc finger TraR family protein
MGGGEYAVSDIVDRAQREEEAFQDAALARLRRAPGANPLPAPAASDCISCGDPISAERRAAVPEASTCTPCQALIEAKWRRR